MPYAHLPQRSLLRLSGEDALPFLQGLVTNDVLRLPREGIMYSALLSPQGKFLHDFFLIAQGGDVLVDCDKERIADLKQRLGIYKLRSKVAIEMMPGTWGVAALWDEPVAKAEGVIIAQDPRVLQMGWRAAGEKSTLEVAFKAMQAADAQAYDKKRLSLGVPEGGKDLVADKSFILPYGFEALHGVDFKKGCYIGQEVTARSKHLGQLRKHIYSVRGEGVLPEAGTPVYAGEKQVGELRSAQGHIGLALLNSEDIAGKPSLACGATTLSVTLPDWAKNA